MTEKHALIISGLRDTLTEASESLKANKYERLNEESVRALSKYIDNTFKSRIKELKSYESSHGTEKDDFPPEVLKRRKQAILRSAIGTEPAVKNRYPEISVEEEAALLNAPCGLYTFDRLESVCHIELAAAIRVLDYLKSNGKLDEALALLPEKRSELDEVNLPYITDSVHPDDLIRGMLYVIHFRNRESDGFDAAKSFMNAADASEKTDSIYRSRFDALIDLIDKDTVSAIEEQFIRYVNQTTDRLLRISVAYRRKANELNREIIAEIEAFFDKYGIEKTDSQDTAEASLTCSIQDIARFEQEAEALQSMIAENTEILRESELQKEALFMNIPALNPLDIRDISGLSNESAISDPQFPGINDPFGMCFGFLKLLDSDSDYVWTYNPAYIVLASACAELPWAGFDAALSDGESDRSKINPDFEKALAEKQSELTASESLLEKRSVIPPFGESGDRFISFSQLTFLFSGIIPPRGSADHLYTKALLTDESLTEREKQLLCEYLTLACSVSARDENYAFIDEEDEAASQSETDNTIESDNYPDELRELKRENKGLKSLINKLEHRIKESEKALSIANKSLDETAAELAELRSMIRDADGAEEPVRTTVSLPYTAVKRAVVFGGHESWSKAIKTLLNNVRFVDASAQPNTGLIMNADVVWIQTNAISHASFYKIIDVIRKHGIELRYFKYASAEKCAEQFALEDMALSGNE